MPLEHSKSGKAFVNNLKAELFAGKPKAQSLAIAYATKRRAGKKMAMGGEMGEYDPMENPQPKDNEAANMEDADMIARIMHKRKMYSEGGMVANDVGVAEADKLPAEYDDLVLRDELEDAYTGANSGDEDGSTVKDDPIDRIMMKRKKDKMPRPA